jgi:hypothetical protein
MSVRLQKTPRDEGAGTARIVTRARKEIAAGAPLLPKDVVDRMANGENPVRVLREWRDRDWPDGMTQMYLSFKQNLAKAIFRTLKPAAEQVPRRRSASLPMHWTCR